jgi:oxygen-dependent protoporphyrinogen oxidase
VLVPEVERRQMLGVLFSSSLFPERAPADHVALTVLLGGSRQPGLTRREPADLLPMVLDDLRSLFQISGGPVFQRQVTWPRAIPQYNLGYENHLETMAQAERDHPGLFIGGQARDGIGLGQCLLSGLRLAEAAGRLTA